VSAVAELPLDAAAGNRLARRNALVLAAGQALAGGNGTVVTATGGILGAMLAPDKSLATLPVSIMVVGTWAGTLPVGFLVRRFGRRSAYQIGAAVGCLAGLIGYTAVVEGSFVLYLAATFCAGLYQASHQSYRFAAADTAAGDFKGKAVSWVLAGGLFAAFLGPQLVILTKDLMPPYLFAASYLGQAATAACAVLVLSLVRAHRHAAPVVAGRARPLSEITRQPRFVVAAICGVASYAVMNLMMTAAPLAMVDCGHSVGNAALGIQWHVLAMYAPSFITGGLIVRFGATPVVATGLALLAASALSVSQGKRSLIFGSRWRCSASAGTSLLSAPPRCCSIAIARMSAPKCRRSTIFSSSAPWRSARLSRAPCSRTSAGISSTW
jgi:MFS family permease